MDHKDAGVSKEIRDTIIKLDCEFRALKRAAGFSPGGRGEQSTVSEQDIRQTLAARRKRDEQLGPSLFGDPAWDILLEAFAAHLAGHQVEVVDLARGASVAETTAVRWVKALEQHGWLTTSGDRLRSVEMSNDGALKLRRLFGNLGAASFLV